MEGFLLIAITYSSCMQGEKDQQVGALGCIEKKSCLSDAAMLLGAHNCILRILVETDQIFSCTALNSKVHTLRNFVLAHYLNLKSESNTMFMMP